MTPSEKQIIVVVGATGKQGSSVAHTFLESPNWYVRCLTRNPSSQASQSLLSLGAEIVQADLSDISSLYPAFANAHTIFANTDFWGTYRASVREGETDSNKVASDQEVKHGKNAAIAAARIATLEHFIYSALPPMKKYSQGKFPHSYYSDSKAAVVEYVEKEQPELAKKMSLIYLGAYTTNPFLTPSFDAASGTYKLVVPLKKESRLPIVNPEVSTGPFVRALVESEPVGMKLLAYDSYLSFEEIKDLWSRVTGKSVVLVELSVEQMREKLGVAIEVLDGIKFIEEFGYTGGVEGVIEPGDLKEKIETGSFEQWLRKSGWKKTLGKLEQK